MENVGDFFFLIPLFLTLFFVAIFYLIGKRIENKHLRSLAEREEKNRNVVVTNLGQVPEGYEAMHGELCIGSVVIGTDYYKRFAAGLKTLIGGRLLAFETVLERGRREAVLRMVQDAKSKGADFIINVRVETATIGSSTQQQNFASAEVVAYGTGVRRKG